MAVKKLKKKPQKKESNDWKSRAEWLDKTFWARMGASIDALPKKPVTIRVDPIVLSFFKSFGDGYQTRMHAILKDFAMSYPERQMEQEQAVAVLAAKRKHASKKA